MGRTHYRAKGGRWTISKRQRVRDAQRPDPSGCRPLESCLRSKDSRAVWRGTGRKGSNDLARGLLYLVPRSRCRQQLKAGVGRRSDTRWEKSSRCLSICYRAVRLLGATAHSRRRNEMSSTTDRAEIEALFQQLARAHADHDANAIVEAYAPDAVIYDLAPPLGRRGMHRDSVVAWLAGWEGPIQIEARDVNLAVDGHLAFVSALNSMRGRQGGADQDLWYRTTMCLRKTSGRWRIVCDHSSVPFYMDGSYRAAVDLKP